MLRNTWIKRAGWVGAAALLLATGAPLHAQEEQAQEKQAQEKQAQEPRLEVRRLKVGGTPQDVLLAVEQAQPVKLSDYWIGLSCGEVAAALRSHLGLGSGVGIVVEQVVDDSPAAKAGLKEHDVLIKAGDKSLGAVGALIEAVDAAKDKELTLEIVRGGKTLTIKVTPQKRAEATDKPAGDEYRQSVRKWLSQIHPGAGQNDQFEFRILQPGAVLPPNKEMPKDLSISITRSGSEPAKIVVKKGDKRWEVGEDKLSELPEDVRPHVDRMLGRGPRVFAMPHFQSPATPPAVPVPPVPAVRALQGIGKYTVRSEAASADVGKQLREVQEQLEKLNKQVEALQKSLPKQKE